MASARVANRWRGFGAVARSTQGSQRPFQAPSLRVASMSRTTSPKEKTSAEGGDGAPDRPRAARAPRRWHPPGGDFNQPRACVRRKASSPRSRMHSLRALRPGRDEQPRGPQPPVRHTRGLGLGERPRQLLRERVQVGHLESYRMESSQHGGQRLAIPPGAHQPERLEGRVVPHLLHPREGGVSRPLARAHELLEALQLGGGGDAQRAPQREPPGAPAPRAPPGTPSRVRRRRLDGRCATSLRGCRLRSARSWT